MRLRYLFFLNINGFMVVYVLVLVTNLHILLTSIIRYESTIPKYSIIKNTYNNKDG